jgi:glycine/D-amino acid oxidase-like deaminating enzyme
MLTNADVVVIGAGAFGASTAYHLARRGQRVVLLDAHEPVTQTSPRAAGLTQQIRSDTFMPPEQANEHPDLPQARLTPTNRIIAALEEWVEVTAANELMIFTTAYGIEQRIRSLELLAQTWHAV